LLQNHTPTADTELYQRFCDAGLVVFGKTNTPEFGILPVTEPDVAPPTRNPWDLSRTCGGSSGGAGAAVAAGIVPMAHAGDGGGSIRIPASCAGLFGFKPTRARTPGGPIEHWSGFALEHVISRSVRDSAAALDAVEGPQLQQPYYPPPKAGPYRDEVGRDPGKLRIAFTSKAPMPSKVHPDCIAAMESTAKLLEELGHDVEEIDPRYDARANARHFVLVVGANTATAIRDAEIKVGRKARFEDLQLTTWLSAAVGHAYRASEFVRAKRALHEEAARMAERMQSYDLLLTPTLGQPPVRIGELEPSAGERRVQELLVRTKLHSVARIDAVMERTISEVFQFIAFTPFANFSGQPAMSVPLHWNDAGLPIGTMLAAPFGRDDLLFRVAAQLEEARPWRDRRPTL
ncbi:MAG: amidase, partial [Myxococcota bacterium]